MIWTIGLQPAARQVLFCGRRPHLCIVYVF